MNADNCASKRRAPLPLRDRFRAFQNPATALALAVLCFFIAAPAHAADKTPPVAATAPAAKLPGDDIAAGIRSRGKPSDKDNNAVFMPLIGTWDYDGSFWTGAKGEPEHATGTVTNDTVLSQHYLSSKAVGNLNVGHQQIPFESEELIGFDTARKAYTLVQADSLTTGVMIGSGTFDEKSRTLNSTGHFTNPLTGAEEHFRSELKLVDLANYKRTVFAADKSGKETKLFEINYTRRK